MKRIEVEIDFEKTLNAVLEETVVKGLQDDKTYILKEYDTATFEEMEKTYRYYGALFGVNYIKNLENYFEKIINKED